MPLVTTTEMFKKAYEGGYAIGAFNVNNMEIIQGITRACKKHNAPVILQVSAGARKYASHNYLVAMVKAVAEETGLPIALHLDHGPDFETCKACIDGGFTSVMIDGSSLPYEENIALTKMVVEYAHAHGVVVEGELGTLAGIEDAVNVSAEDASFTKPEQVLEKLEDNLGVMSVARPPEVREYGFLPAGVYDKDTFALRLMDKPASYFYSVLWNKLYRRILLTGNDIQFTSELKWAEDLVFNMQYIQYAETFVSIDKAGYYYVQNPQSICHTQINPASIVQNKIQTFRYYKDLYTRLGMYEEVRPQLYKFLVDIAESTYPSGPFKKIIEEAKEYWKNRKE